MRQAALAKHANLSQLQQTAASEELVAMYLLTPPFGLFMYCLRYTYALLGCKRTRRQQHFAVQTGLLQRHKQHSMFWPLPFGLTLEVQVCAKIYGSSLGWLEMSTNSTQHTYFLSIL